MPDLGDLVPLTISVLDEDGNPSNATDVTLVITQPDGSTESVPITNPPTVTGQYEVDYQPASAGRYLAKWNTTTPTAAFTDTFDVRDLAARSIISLRDAKLHLNMSLDRTTDDEELRNIIEAVTAVVERHRSEVIARRTVVESDVMGCGSRMVLQHRPVLSVTSIVDEDGTSYTVGDWTLDGTNGTLTKTTASLTYKRFTVTYVAGYQQIPAHYILAAKIILHHLWQTQRVQSVGAAPTFGGQSRRDEQIVTPSGLGFAIPHRAIELLGTRPSMIV